MENQQNTPEKKTRTRKIIKHYMICDCGCKFLTTSRTKHLNSVKHVMMLGGATIDEYNKYVGDKAELTGYIHRYENNTYSIDLSVGFVKFFDRFVDRYNGYKEKYGLDDPWLENVESNRMVMDLKSKLIELKML